MDGLEIDYMLPYIVNSVIQPHEVISERHSIIWIRTQ